MEAGKVRTPDTGAQARDCNSEAAAGCCRSRALTRRPDARWGTGPTISGGLRARNGRGDTLFDESLAGGVGTRPIAGSPQILWPGALGIDSAHHLLMTPNRLPLLCLFLILLASSLVLDAAERGVIDTMPAHDAAIVDAQLPDARILPGGIRFVEKKAGTGAPLVKGDRVTALYVGKLITGEIFNQKQSLFHSYRFEVGAQPRQVIRGWEVALLHMQEGGSYTVAIPSEFAYRDYGRPGQVPPHATLIFDIDIAKVERPSR